MQKLTKNINGTTPRGLYNYACEFLEAFRVINEKDRKITYLFPVKYYLLCHSLELGLKSYLRSKGYSINKLKDLGHNLTEILEEAHKQKFDSLNTKKEKQIINLLNLYYFSKQFEYITVGFKSVPEIMAVEKLVQKVLDEIEQFSNELINCKNIYILSDVASGLQQTKDNTR